MIGVYNFMINYQKIYQLNYLIFLKKYWMRFQALMIQEIDIYLDLSHKAKRREKGVAIDLDVMIIGKLKWVSSSFSTDVTD